MPVTGTRSPQRQTISGRASERPTFTDMKRRVTIADLDDWARAHHGLITFERSGMSRRAWYRALDAGELDALHAGVARLYGTPTNAEQRIAAAQLACPDAIISHRSAARLWGIPRPDGDPVDLIRPRRATSKRMRGVIVHRPRDREHLIPQRRYGIACTSILRTLLDLGAVDASAVPQAVGHAIAAKLVTLTTLEHVLTQHAAPGRNGVTALRRSIDEWSIDQKPADSLLEAAMARLARRHQLPPLEFHPTIEGRVVDFRVIGTNVILECDGWAYHGLDRQRFERDRERDASLIAAGWIVIRFTYRSITERAGEVATRIRAAVARWSPKRPA